MARVGGGYSPFDAFLRSIIPPKLVKHPKTVPRKVKEEPQPNKIIIMRNINNPNFMPAHESLPLKSPKVILLDEFQILTMTDLLAITPEAKLRT